MEKILIALDGTSSSLKCIQYVNRMLAGNDTVRFYLFHVLPTTSPNLLKKEEVARIESLHQEQSHLGGYFWSPEDQAKMSEIFRRASELLAQGGFAADQVETRFGVESDEIAQIILNQAKALNCATVVVGRRGLGRVKEFFIGSISKSVVSSARKLTVWVVDL